MKLSFSVLGGLFDVLLMPAVDSIDRLLVDICSSLYKAEQINNDRAAKLEFI